MTNAKLSNKAEIQFHSANPENSISTIESKLILEEPTKSVPFSSSSFIGRAEQ